MAGAAGSMLRAQASLISAARSGSSSREKDKVKLPGLGLRDPLEGTTRLDQNPRTGRQIGETVALEHVAPAGHLYGEEHPVAFRRPRCHPVGPDRRPRPSPVRPRECQALAQLLQCHPPAKVGTHPRDRRYEELIDDVRGLLTGELVNLHGPEASAQRCMSQLSTPICVDSDIGRRRREIISIS